MLSSEDATPPSDEFLEEFDEDDFDYDFDDDFEEEDEDEIRESEERELLGEDEFIFAEFDELDVEPPVGPPDPVPAKRRGKKLD